jgi:hypothetical protein
VSGDTSFRIASSKIISDVIDGEAVLVNLASGDYYTLDPVGREVWELMEAGLSCESVVTAMTGLYEGDRETIQAGVLDLLSDLRTEGLVIEGSPAASPVAKPKPSLDDRPAFSAPVLTKYTDMEDLLTLDPVHEVDDLGWPHVPRADTA